MGMMADRAIERLYALKFCKCKIRFWKNYIYQPCKFRASFESGELLVQDISRNPLSRHVEYLIVHCLQTNAMNNVFRRSMRYHTCESRHAYSTNSVDPRSSANEPGNRNPVSPNSIPCQSTSAPSNPPTIRSKLHIPEPNRQPPTPAHLSSHKRNPLHHSS